MDEGTGRGARGLWVAVLGPGGVGGLLGALLARDGADVVCLAGAGDAVVQMQRDAVAGRPLEVDAIARAAVRAADRHGVAVPVTRGLVEQLRERSG